MVWEIAQLEILDGHNEEFETALIKAAPLFERTSSTGKPSKTTPSGSANPRTSNGGGRW